MESPPVQQIVKGAKMSAEFLRYIPFSICARGDQYKEQLSGMTAAKKRRKECVMKKRIVSLLCAGLLVFSEPYPTPAAQSAGTEAITDHSEEVPCACS